ncbi:MAG: Spy/CpxP family protein refolding chaperone [Syntrophales bacterium]|nr:Spy/CpxP family protein refolding chaperone [Syntrophales bacterium]
MKKKLAFLVIAILALTAMYTPAESRHGWWGCPSGPADITTIRDLNLTSEQAAKLSSLREAYLRETKPIRDKLFSKNGELRILWLQQPPDQEKIISLQREIDALRSQLREKHTVYRLEIQKILTPEQQAKLKLIQVERGPRRGMHCRH